MITLTIDDVKVEVPEGTTVLEAAENVEIYIPRLCYHPDLSTSKGLRTGQQAWKQGSGGELLCYVW